MTAETKPLEAALATKAHECRDVRGRTVREIHEAFGAPGDFGYDTPLGDALASLYRGGA